MMSGDKAMMSARNEIMQCDKDMMSGDKDMMSFYIKNMWSGEEIMQCAGIVLDVFH